MGCMSNCVRCNPSERPAAVSPSALPVRRSLRLEPLEPRLLLSGGDWTSYLGGAVADTGHGIAVDGDGNVYVTGQTTSGGLLAGSNDGAMNNAYRGGGDAFVLKLSASGELIWGTYLGGTASDGGRGIAVDDDGYVYVTGFANSTAFSGGSNNAPANPTGSVYEDAFVAKLTPAGALDWATFLGGNSNDLGNGIAVDAGGNVYIAGQSNSADFVGGTNAGTPNNSFKGASYDAFAAKLTSSGALTWATFLGSTSTDIGFGVAVDPAGYVYVTGNTWNSAFTGGSNDLATNNNARGGYDAFVVRLTPAGAMDWATRLGGNNWEEGFGVALDNDGNIYVTGYTQSTLFTGGSNNAGTNNNLKGNKDAFVARLTPSGALTWATYLGGSGDDSGQGIVINDAGNVFIAGYTASESFTGGSNNAAAGNAALGSDDAFAAKLTPLGAMTWATRLGGVGADQANGLVLANSADLLLTGYTASDDFSGGSNNSLKGGTQDAFAAKLLSDAPVIGSLSRSADSLAQGRVLTLTAMDLNDGDGTIMGVEFYRDSNGNGVLDPGTDEKLGEDVTSAGGWTWTGPTISFPVGAQTFFARAQDDDGVWGDAVSTSMTILQGPTLIGTLQGAGEAAVHVYDCSPGSVDVSLANVIAKFGKQGDVQIQLAGVQAMNGLGLVITGVTEVKAITDARKGALGDLAFIASDAPIKSVQLKGGMTGAGINEMSLGGLNFAADIDGDGNTSDLTALYSTGPVAALRIDGTVAGDLWIGGADAKGLAFKSYQSKAGGLQGDLRAQGSGGSIALAGDMTSTVAIAGSLSSIQIKNGSLGGTIHVTGTLGKVAVAGGGVSADITVDGVVPKTGVSLTSLQANSGIISGALVTAGSAGTISATGFTGQANIAGSLKALQLKGGDFGGAVNVTGDLTKLEVKAVKAIGGSYRAGATVTVGQLLKTVALSAYETDNSGEAFGITSAWYSTLTLGATKLKVTALPFQDGDFRVALA